MALVDYTLHDHVALLTMNSGENRFNPGFLETFLNVLDEIENQTSATVLVVNSSHEKIWSNGIDLEWLWPIIQEKDTATAKRFFYQLNRVFKQLVTLPLVTVAAITGHAFAGGAIISCAFDFRFMRSDRGYLCLPEVDLGIPFLPGMNALLGSAIPEQVLRNMQLTGVRLTAQECQQNNIVLKACHHDELMDAVMDFAKQINKRRPVIAELKARLNSKIVHALDVEDVPHIESGQFNI
ncbi:MAG: enoyl-CoA hydratase/isomerase family protein [Desulfobacteraceae bacterium]|nr:enoyl-CoA hydratase/isomerase family protein [Desulfobacteraceae bacterium]